MIRTASLLLVAFYLLTSPATVHAECAWVLWTTSYKMSGDKPVHELVLPSEAYATKVECERIVAQRESTEDERRKKDPTVNRFYACLPDAVDPRGPKERVR